jgi:signal transduction histidine kinase
MASGRTTSAEDMRRLARVEARALRSRLGTGAPMTTLVDDVRQTASDAELATGVRVEVTWEEGLAQPGSRVAEALVGAAREALTNTAKHAQVGRATVRVQSWDGGVEVVVRDEGCGFDALAGTQGFGTSQSISARMAEVGGRATIASRPGLGTTVRLWGPLE